MDKFELLDKINEMITSGNYTEYTNRLNGLKIDLESANEDMLKYIETQLDNIKNPQAEAVKTEVASGEGERGGGRKRRKSRKSKKSRKSRKSRKPKRGKKSNKRKRTRKH